MPRKYPTPQNAKISRDFLKHVAERINALGNKPTAECMPLRGYRAEFNPDLAEQGKYAQIRIAPQAHWDEATAHNLLCFWIENILGNSKLCNIHLGLRWSKAVDKSKPTAIRPLLEECARLQHKTNVPDTGGWWPVFRVQLLPSGPRSDDELAGELAKRGAALERELVACLVDKVVLFGKLVDAANVRLLGRV